MLDEKDIRIIDEKLDGLGRRVDEKFAQQKAETAEQLRAMRVEMAEQLDVMKAETAEQLRGIRADVAEQLDAMKAETAEQLRGIRADVAEQLDAQSEKYLHMMKVLIESEITPKFNLLADGQKMMLETLAPKSRVAELEDQVDMMKQVIKLHSQEIAALKKAQ